MSADGPVTALLQRAKSGDSAALNELLPLVYSELHRLALSALQRERPGHTLQPTALLNEAFLRIFGGQAPDFDDRAHFLGIYARVMRQVLVDHARARAAEKRGGTVRVEFVESMAAAQPAEADVLDLNDAMDKLGREDPRLVTLIEMRFFGGMSAQETAAARAESVHVVRHDLRYAQARLRRILATRGR